MTKPDSWRHATRQVLWILLWVLFVTFAIGALVRGAAREQVIWLDAVCYPAIYYVGAFLMLTCKGRGQDEQLAWYLFSVASFAMVTGDMYYSLFLADEEEVGPSAADFFYLSWFPLVYLALVFFLRSRNLKRHVALWLDGLVAGFGTTAIISAFVMDDVLSLTHGSFLGTSVNLAYPVGDLLLVLFLVTTSIALGQRPDRQLTIITAGLLLYVFADSVYLVENANGTYSEGGWLDLIWLLGIMCIAAAAMHEAPPLQPSPAHETQGEKRLPSSGKQRPGTAVPPEGLRSTVSSCPPPAGTTSLETATPDINPLRSALRVLLLPGTFALIALILLAMGQMNRLAPVPTVMCDLCLVLAFARILGVLMDVRRREAEALREAWHQARTDELTGLPNRRAISARCQEMVQQVTPEQPVSLLLLDVDRFKDINDSLGHSCGDALLIQIADRLRDVLPSSCYLARLGGDEFGALLPGRPSQEAMVLGRAVRGAIAPPLTAGGIRLHLDASVGVATITEPMESHTELLRFADIAMYRAKRERLGVVAFDGQAGSATTLDQLRTVEELRGALRGEDRSRNGNLVMHLQPQLRLSPADRRGEVAGVEALVRWEHPARGLLPPGSFLPLIEMAGLRSLLAETVLDLSLGICRDWWYQGHEIPVSVNLSVAEIEDRLLPERIQAVLRRHRLPGRALVVEMTEDLLMVDPRRARSVLDRIRRIGVGASIDDYGTGYSSLSYLQELAVDELKLDRGFIANLTTDPASVTIIRTTVDLAHSLGLRLVAEGIEDEATEEVLAELGCDIGQGYHLSRPMPGAQMLAWLQARSPAQGHPAGREENQEPTARPSQEVSSPSAQ